MPLHSRSHIGAKASAGALKHALRFTNSVVAHPADRIDIARSRRDVRFHAEWQDRMHHRPGAAFGQALFMGVVVGQTGIDTPFELLSRRALAHALVSTSAGLC